MTPGLVLAGFLALALASANTAADSANAPSPDASRRAQLARQIVDITDPADIVLEAQLAGWRGLERADISRDPLMVGLEGKCPGIVKAGINAAEPIASNQLRKLLPIMRGRKAGLLANGLSVSELDAIHAFVSSGTGQRYFRGTYSSPGTVVINRLAEGEPRPVGSPVPRADLAIIEQGAAENGMRQLDDSDRRVLRKFQKSEAGKKLMTLQSAIDEMLFQAVGEIDPEIRQQEARAMQAAMMDYIHSHCGASH